MGVPLEKTEGSAARPEERRQGILDAVQAGEASVHDLSARFGVSHSTIRRDLARLGAGGHLARTYGGAVGGVSRLERSLQEREQHMRLEKEAIAAAAQPLIADDEVVILDAGSTIGGLAARLRHRDGLRVITNSLNSMVALSDARGIDVVVLGGELRSLNQATLGSMTEANLRTMLADRVVLSGTAVHPEHGLAAPTLAHAHLKAAMIERAGEVMVLADHTKLGAEPPQHWTALDRPWTLITDSGADTRTRWSFEALPTTQVITAEVQVPESSRQS